MSSDARAPLVYLIDIETSPNLSYTWSGKYEQNVIQFHKEWELLSFAYKELGRGKTKCIARPDFKDKTDRSLTKAAWEILNQSDAIIGHNLNRFDNRKLKAKFIEHGLAPPKPYKTIDTLVIARQQFAFNSNSLNDLAFTLKLGRKVKTGGFELWLSCMNGDPAAWKLMRRYNCHDVDLLSLVYDRLRAWHQNHPDLARMGDARGCPVCKSGNIQRRGYQVMKTRKAARFQCQDCGAWHSRALAEVA